MDLQKINQETEKDVLKMTFKGSPQRGKSRICGYITDAGDMLIAEIRLKELPKNEYFPDEGYLQFFIDAGLDTRGFVVYSESPFDEGDCFEAEGPVMKPARIVFEAGKESISFADNRIFNYMTIEELDEVMNEIGNGCGSKMLGWPAFCQQDPREGDHKVLLLQLDSDGKYINWGDAGVGNFFIDSGKLRELDFSDVLFYWDCY